MDRPFHSALFVDGWALGPRWLFILAPRIGAAIAAALYGAVYAPEPA